MGLSALKKTVLHSLYAKYGAKTIDFGGWDLPVQFSGIGQEHEAVRTAAGLFDVSHMGEFRLSGKGSLDFLQRVMTNDVARLEDGQVMYTFMCYPDGGVVDDLLIYKLQDEEYMLVVNAANIDKDIEWLQKHIEGDSFQLRDESETTGLLALQGPLAQRILAKLTDAPWADLGAYRFWREVSIGGLTAAVVSRTGYTGEDGFEIYAGNDTIATLWELLLEAGAEDGLVAAGLGARDTLRFEARLPLYGQELSASISPIEAGLSMFVKIDKGVDFIGREALAKQRADGTSRKLVGIEMVDRGIPRTHYPVYSSESGDRIGEVTTGTQSPTYKTNVGLALVKTDYATIGTELWVEIRGKRLKAKVVKTPFYRKETK